MGLAAPVPIASGNSAPLSPAAVVRANTGVGLSPDTYRQRTFREEKLRDSDNVMAEKLAKCGIEVFTGRALWWVGDVTGKAIPLSRLREVNIFETVQNRHRSFYLKAMQHFAAGHPGSKNFRYAVITTPGRIPMGADMWGLKRRMMARISEWARLIRRQFDIELLLNSVEYTFDKESRTFFLHFNIVYWPRRVLSRIVLNPMRAGERGTLENWLEARLGFEGLYIKPEGENQFRPMNAWEAFLRFSHHFLKVHWKDCGRVEKFDEVIKYVLKSVDRDDLKKIECAWLFNENYRSRFIQVYGDAKEHIKTLRANRQKLAYVQDGAGKVLHRIQLPEVEPQERPEPDPDAIRETENLIRGRTPPMAKACAWAEPGTLIEGYTPTPKTGGGRRRLAEAREDAERSRIWWDHNGAPDPRTALAVSEAWLLAASNEAARAISFFCASKPTQYDSNADIFETVSARTIPPAGECAASSVHTTELTPPPPAPGGETTEGQLAAGAGDRLVKPPDKPHLETAIPIKMRIICNMPARQGAMRLEDGAWYDPETGEIL